MIKVKWDVEELVALIDFYLRNREGQIEDLEAELTRLSAALNLRANVLGINHDEKFRNMNGMKMMYGNVEFIATNGSKGMPSVSNSMKIVYQTSQTNPDIFQLILNEFQARYLIKSPDGRQHGSTFRV